MKRYIVGTRDVAHAYRAVRVEARSQGEAKKIAVRRSEDVGLYVIAVSCSQVNALGMVSR